MASNERVYLGPSPFAQPAQPGGLEGLASRVPCATRIGLKAKDCVTNWAAAVGKAPTLILFAIAALYWGAGMAAGPAWNNWIDALIPRDRIPQGVEGA